jgi:hypothetical protein
MEINRINQIILRKYYLDKCSNKILNNLPIMVIILNNSSLSIKKALIRKLKLLNRYCLLLRAVSCIFSYAPRQDIYTITA